MTEHKYKKLTKLKLTDEGAEEFNDSDDYDADNPWKEGDIITVEPTTKELCERYDEEDYWEDGYDTYCIHEHMTKNGWSLRHIEDTNKFKPVKIKVTNWKKELM